MRKKVYKIVLVVLAIIGAISSLMQIYDFFKSENEAKEYRKNCEMIKVGMTVTKKVMGDYKWFRKNTRSEIWIEGRKNDSKSGFYLSYPAKFGASGWPMIYFDPNTMTVTKVICDE